MADNDTPFNDKENTTTKADRRDEKRRKEKSQTPQHGRASLRIREQAEQKREKEKRKPT
jgi:hypothetical protein